MNLPNSQSYVLVTGKAFLAITSVAREANPAKDVTEDQRSRALSHGRGRGQRRQERRHETGAAGRTEGVYG